MYSKIHKIDEEMYQRLLDMVHSVEGNDIGLACEIILNSDTDDLHTCHYIEELSLTLIINQNATQNHKDIGNFYLNLKQQPSWKKVQEAHLAFQDDLFGLFSYP
jgi:hypothetical protein